MESSWFCLLFLFEEAADILHYALTILTFVAIIIVIWDLVGSYQSYNLAYLYEKMTPSSPLEFYLAQALENAKESQMVPDWRRSASALQI